ncbi:hypothetical protein GALMADRAFT_58846 [Galerina marginata CBS 339.88]|uniref:Uncharacterized protein n=1 Tax=Galerina marginata (strain CBS 339.88) TaxID=685588 RepID=A0A067TFY4_GALM3|nr:hypothetical protein GALMADRAFT_58846 [Galerina marginata CBS 339.88]
MKAGDEENDGPSPTKKRKLTKATEAKLKAKEKKKKGKKDDDGNYEDDEEDAYTALSKSLWKNSSSKPPVGSFENCAVCEKQFTVTKYTMAANSGNGFLCHQCAKLGGNDPFKKPAVLKKRKAPADKRNITNFEEKRFPTLVSLCIQLITKHIDDIDALGDIGTLNVEAISKALSKSRSLTPENVHLFYSPANSSLTLFDATNLPSPALETLAYHNTNLVSLRLDFCGRLDDASFMVFSTSLPALERLELLGPFLVRPAAWQEFFKSHPKLEAFLITQSPRFDEACIKSLVKSCPGVKELRLKEIGKMNDTFVNQIKTLKKGLRYLDLSDPTNSCGETAIIGLIRAIGRTLTYLNLSKHDSLTDKFLDKGVLPHTKVLESLVLSHLPELTDHGVSKFFESWTNPALISLDLSRNEVLKSEALESALKHSGSKLEELNINGCMEIGEDSLKMIASDAVEVKKLDVGFCRAVDDFVIQTWLEGVPKRKTRTGGCRQLEEVKVWGCNRVSSSCPRKKGVIILGVESHTVR